MSLGFGLTECTGGLLVRLDQVVAGARGDLELPGATGIAAGTASDAGLGPPWRADGNRNPASCDLGDRGRIMHTHNATLRSSSLCTAR